MRVQVSRLPDIRKIVTGTVMPAVPAKHGKGQASPAVPASAPGRDVAWGARALRSLAGVFVVTWSFRLSGYLTFTPWLAVPVAILGLTGLLVIVAAWLPGSVLDNRRQRQIGWVALVAVIMALALWSYIQVFVAPDYGTDEIAFDQYAAQLAWHGIDPYLRSMAPAFPLFHVSPNGYTFQLNGQPVTTLSYPALSFEAYLPLLALGVTTQAAVWTNVGAWALGAVILYAVLPRDLAPLAVVVASADIYIGYAVGGVTDALFVPLLIGAAVNWDRFASARGAAAWRGPICLGLAMAVKQTPWFVAIFVVPGIVLEVRRDGGMRQALRAGLRYAGIAATSFLLPNLPYLIDSPGAWLHGILTPLMAHAVPAGQGLVSLSLSLMVGGGSLLAYNVAAVVVLGALIACYVVTYPALKPAAFLLPSIALFFAARSFGSYLVMLIPAALAAAATTPAFAALAALAGVEVGRGLRRGRLRGGGGHRRNRSKSPHHVDPVRADNGPARYRATGDRAGHQQHGCQRAARLHRRGRRYHNGLLAAAAGTGRARPPPDSQVHHRGAQLFRDAVHRERLPGPRLPR